MGGLIRTVTSKGNAVKRRSLQILAAGAATALALALVPAAAATAATTITTNGNIYHGYGYTIKPDGTSSGIAKYAGATFYDQNVSFSPDGTRIVYTTQADAGLPSSVVTAQADFTRKKTIYSGETFTTNYPLAPVWSPNGARIAYVVSSDNAASRIVTVNPDGTAKKEITNVADMPSASRYVSWYPDSDRVLYVNKTNQLCTVSTTTSAKSCKNLPSQTVSGSASSSPFGEPKLSPDGTTVLLSLWQNETTQRLDIARVSVNGTNFVNLTGNDQGLRQATDAVWSPDGSSVAFNYSPAAANEYQQIAVMSKNGTNLKLLAATAGHSGETAWQPKVTAVNDPSALAVSRVGYCGNDGGTYAWLNLKATWKADPKASVASYRIYENGTNIKNVTNTRLNAGTLSATFSSSQWWAEDAKTLIYTVKGVTAAGVETGPSNTVTINVPALDC
jgi:Tol biopolymer transport system component